MAPTVLTASSRSVSASGATPLRGCMVPRTGAAAYRKMPESASRGPKPHTAQGAPTALIEPLLRGDGLVRLQRGWDRKDRLDGSWARVHRTRPADIANASTDAARAQAGWAVRNLHGDEATSESGSALVHRDLLR